MESCSLSWVCSGWTVFMAKTDAFFKSQGERKKIGKGE